MSASASAALTPSEKDQIRGFVASGMPANAARVRALAARPDLSADETRMVLTDAFVAVPFDEARAAFARGMLFGPASAASRPVLVTAAVNALLARADMLLLKNARTLSTNDEAAGELIRIYSFINSDVSNADARSPSSSAIPKSAFEACGKALGEHFDRHPTVLKAGTPLTGAAERVRAQAQVALVELIGDAPVQRFEAAERLGLSGSRKQLFTEEGVLVLDDGRGDNNSVDQVRGVLDGFPNTRKDVQAIYFGSDKPTIKARGEVLNVKSSLEGSATTLADVFGDEVRVHATEPPLTDAARDLASIAVKKGLDARPELRAQVEHDVHLANGAPHKLLGIPSDASSPDAVLGSAVTLLLTDAPRAIDLAFVRYLGGRPEPAALLSDALGVLAAASATQGTVRLGRVKTDGTVESIEATGLRTAANGAVVGFALGGHTWSLTRDDSGVSTAKRDGSPVTLAALPTARMPVTSGSSWTNGGLIFAKLQGVPAASVAEGGHVRMVATGTPTFEAIATPAPSDDVVVEGQLVVDGEAGGIAVRALSGKDRLQGIALVLHPEQGKAFLQSLTATAETDLGPAVAITAGPVHRIRLTIKRDAVEAVIDARSIKAQVGAPFEHGDVALLGRRGAQVEITGLHVRKP